MSSHHLLASIVADEKSAVNLGSPCSSLVGFLLLLSRFSLCFYLSTLYLDVDLFEFIFFRRFLASWINFLKITFEKFQPLFLPAFFPAPLSLSSHSGTPVMHMLVHLMVTPNFLSLCLFSFVLFLYFFIFVFQIEYFPLSSLIFLFFL